MTGSAADLTGSAADLTGSAADLTDRADLPEADSGAERSPPRRRSRVILWVCVGVAFLLAALIAVLASSKPVTNGSESPLIGHPAPSVSGNGINMGGRYSLSDYSGKWVLLNFSASWCVPCQEETPQLVDFENEHAKTGDAVILAVEFDEGDKAALASFLESSKATWPAVDDSQAVVSYGLGGIPESYLIDPRGTVVAKFVGGVTAAGVDQVIDKGTSSG